MKDNDLLSEQHAEDLTTILLMLASEKEQEKFLRTMKDKDFLSDKLKILQLSL